MLNIVEKVDLDPINSRLENLEILCQNLDSRITVLENVEPPIPPNYGKVGIITPNIVVDENLVTTIIQVERFEGSDGSVSVAYGCADGTAKAGIDYVNSSGVLSWQPNELGIKNITVSIIDDSIYENNETKNFSVNLSNPIGGVVLENSVINIGIKDNEVAPPPVNNGQVRINNTVVNVSENVGTVTIQAERFNGSDGAVSVNFATINGTAQAGIDYVNMIGTLNWNATEIGVKNIIVPINDDLIFENNETKNFTVNLSNPTGGLIINGGTSTIGIQDNELPPSPRSLISQSDVTLLGTFDIQGNAAVDLNYGMGFTHRYDNGVLKFMCYTYNGGNLQLVEFNKPSFGNTINVVSRNWGNINGSFHNGPGYWRNLWWDTEKDGLWSTAGGDYPDAAGLIDPKTLVFRKLNSNGTVSGVRGIFGIPNIGGRATYGGIRKVPQWFQAQNGVGKYLVGFGGYTSLMAQTLKSSMGPFFATISDPTVLADNANIPINEVHVLADHRSGSTANDWYGLGTPSTHDRGVRNTDVINYFDGGDPRNNPSTPPSVPPVSGAKWLSPSPDGLGRWVWGDSNWGCGEWIDNDAGTRSKHGIITVGTFYSGKAYYMTSTLWCDRRTAEIQVFNPAHLAEVKAGTRAPWNVKPVNRWEITDIMKQGTNALRARNGAGVEGAASATTFDATTNTLYLMCFWAMNANPWNCRVYAFQVS